jgi:hypothetical protein
MQFNFKKNIFSCLICFCISGALMASSIFFELTWQWITIISGLLYVLSALLLVISWVAPIIFIVLNLPWLAHAWLRGINPIGVSPKPWEELSDWEKISIYLYSIGLPLLTVVAIVGFTLYSISK